MYFLDILLSVNSSSYTSLTISWMLTDNLPAQYSISYYADTTCFPDSTPIVTSGITKTVRTLPDLEVGTAYHITVNATLSDGRTEIAVKSIIASTTAKGLNYIPVSFLNCLYNSSICPSHFSECVNYQFHCHHCSVEASGLYPPQWTHNRLLSAVWGGGE